MTIAQPNSATVGAPTDGKPRDRQRQRAQPRQRVEPEEDQRADAGREQPRQEHDREHRAAQARASSSRKAPSRGEPSSDAIAAKDPAAATTARVRSSALPRVASCNGQHAEPRADRDQRRLRAEHDAEGQRRERGEHDAGQLVDGQRAARLEPVGGRVAARAGQEADRGGRQGHRRWRAAAPATRPAGGRSRASTAAR
jgi:hypothetical protein